MQDIIYPALISKRFLLPTFLLTWVDLGVSSFLSDLRDIHKILIEYPIILDGNFGYDYWMVCFFTQIWSLLWCVPRRGVFFFFFTCPGSKKVIFCIWWKMKETRTEISRRSVKMSCRNVCSGPIWWPKKISEFCQILSYLARSLRNEIA